jgi:hypothetical protein
MIGAGDAIGGRGRRSAPGLIADDGAGFLAYLGGSAGAP